MEKLTCERAKQIDLIYYLTLLGHQPRKVKSPDYWYLSPLRTEKTPSFKVNRKLNVWHDHGTGEGGNLIDFGIRYFKCTVAELLERLSGLDTPSFSFHPQPSSAGHLLAAHQSNAGEKKESPESKIVILDSRALEDKSLLNYLDRRSIPTHIAARFCREVDFLLYGSKQTVIGFPNNAGGYELRNRNFKGSSSPKSITFIDNGGRSLAVFEGFFNFLSFLTINHKTGERQTNFLVLNSLSFFVKSRNLMERHQEVNLYLDRDTAGMNHAREALAWNPDLYKDQSLLYGYHKDLNDWLVSKPPAKKQRWKLGRAF